MENNNKKEEILDMMKKVRGLKPEEFTSSQTLVDCLNAGVREENEKIKSQDDRISDGLWTERMKSGDVKKWDEDHAFGLEFVDGLRRGITESMARHGRFDKIYAVERTKWQYDMGDKMRNEIPEALHPLLDEFITNSQEIARNACQTVELTEAYLKNNSKKKISEKMRDVRAGKIGQLIKEAILEDGDPNSPYGDGWD